MCRIFCKPLSEHNYKGLYIRLGMKTTIIMNTLDIGNYNIPKSNQPKLTSGISEFYFYKIKLTIFINKTK